MADSMLRGELGTDERALCLKICSTANGLAGLVADAEALIAHDTGANEPQTMRIDIFEVMRDAIDAIALAEPDRCRDLSVAIAETTPRHWVGDLTWLRQMVESLVADAAMRAPKAALTLRALHESDAHGQRDALCFLVETMGSAPAVDRDSEASRSLSATLRERRARLLGGETGDTVGAAGITIWLRLPLNRHPRIEPSAPSRSERYAPTRPQSAPRDPTCRGRILVAEDSPTNQLVAKAYLEREGYRVEIAGNGREAVEACRNRPFDLVLMDVSMPDMDGIEAARLIREEEKDGARLAIIALTAHALPEDRDRALAAGMDDHMAKPIDRDQLLEMLDRWVAKPREPQPAVAMSAGAIDVAILNQIEMDSSAGALREVLRGFKPELLDLATRIASAIERDDLDAAARASHSLASSAGTFGCLDLAAYAQMVETACRRGSIAHLRASAAALPIEARRIAASIDAYIDDVAA